MLHSFYGTGIILLKPPQHSHSLKKQATHKQNHTTVKIIDRARETGPLIGDLPRFFLLPQK